MLPLLNMQEAPPPSQSSKHQQMIRTVSISILVMSLPVLYVSFLHVPPSALFRDTIFWFLMSNSIIIVIAADSGMLFFASSSSSSSSSSSCSSSSVDVDIPFVVSGNVSTTGVSVTTAADEVVPVEVVKNQVMVVSSGQQDATAMVAENDDYSYALVLRDDHGELLPKEPESRDIMVVTPSSALVAGEAAPVVRNDGGGGAVMARANRPAGLTASRSVAREEKLLRRRHSHRQSPSHSRALVPMQDKSVVVATTTQEKQLRRAATERRPSPSPAPEEKEKESEYSRLSDEELNRRVEEFIAKFNWEMRLQLEREQLALAAA